jgi:hypothetical protein
MSHNSYQPTGPVTVLALPFLAFIFSLEIFISLVPEVQVKK